MSGQFSYQDFSANAQVTLRLSSGDTIEGNISSLNDNHMEIITSSKDAARKVQVAYGHIVYIEQIKVTTQVPSV